MGQYLEQIPEEIHDHIRSIAASSGLPEGEESVELIAQGWLEKKALFEKMTADFNMEETEDFSIQEARGALLLTYSGSLITLGPSEEGQRRVEYTSIGLRQDVPDSAVMENSALAEDVLLDDPAVFARGPVKKSSPIFKIAVSREELEPEEEAEKLSEATQLLTQEFVELNKTILKE